MDLSKTFVITKMRGSFSPYIVCSSVRHLGRHSAHLKIHPIRRVYIKLVSQYKKSGQAAHNIVSLYNKLKLSIPWCPRIKLI